MKAGMNEPAAVGGRGGSEKLLATAGYYLAILALGLSTAMLGPTLPGLARRTESDLREVSWLFVAVSAGYLVGSQQAGRWYDRLAGHRLLAASLLALAGTLAAIPLTFSLWPLAVVLFALGAAQGGIDVGGNTLVVWVHQDRVAPWMNGLHFCFGIGSILAPLIVAWATSPQANLSWAFWALAALALPGALWLPWLPSPPAPTARETRRGWESRPLLVLWIAVFLGLYVGAEIGFGGWIFSYAVASGLASADDAAYLTTAFWGAFTLGRLLAVPLALRLPPHGILLGDLAGSLVGVGIILGWPNSTLALWTGTVTTGLCMASIFPVTCSLAERRMAITGGVTSWFIVGGAAGSMTLPWLMGQLFASAGPRSVMLALSVDLLVATGVLLGVLARSKLSRT